MRFDALVLNASLRQSLVTVRSIGRRGLAVAAAETHASTPAFSSRWCQQGIVFPPDGVTGAYTAILEEWLARTGARRLIASRARPIRDGRAAWRGRGED